MTASALAKLTNSIRAKSIASTASTSSAREHLKIRNEVAQQMTTEHAIRDGRIDAVAGNGAISELGAGVETPLLSIEDEGEVAEEGKLEIVGPRSNELVREASRAMRDGTVGEDGQVREKEMERLPVVVIKGFAAKGEAKQEVLWDVLSEWAAVLVENQVSESIQTLFPLVDFFRLIQFLNRLDRTRHFHFRFTYSIETISESAPFETIQLDYSNRRISRSVAPIRLCQTRLVLENSPSELDRVSGSTRR